MGNNGNGGNGQFVRTAAVWSGIGSALGAAIGIAAGFVSLLHENTPAVTVTRELVLASLHVMLLIGLFGLWRSGAAGNSTPAKLAFWLAVVSRAIFVVAELTAIFDLNTANVIFGIATPLQGLGMLGLGVAVLTTGLWNGWHSFTPLICGIYPFLILLPAFALSGGPNYYAIGGLSLAYLLLSIAMWQEAAAPQPSKPARMQATTSR
jgi:hypothetical protein